jgi:hypothetical protein
VALGRLQEGGKTAQRIETLVRYWSGPRPVDEAELKVRLLEFFHLVHQVPEAPARARAPSVSKRHRHTRAQASVGPERVSKLTLRQVREIYSAASFSLQQLNAPFNLAITFRGNAPGLCDKEFKKEVGAACHRLSDRIPTWTRAEDACFHYVALFGQAADGAPEALVIGHVPSMHLAKALKRLEKPGKDSKVLVLPTPHRASNLRAETRSHWSLVRRLWWSVSREIITPSGRPLFAVLAPEGDPGPGGGLTGRRYSTSTSVGESARMRAAEELPFLSAFDDHAWDHLYTGWERAEFAVRRVTLEKRAKALAQLEARFPLRRGPEKASFESRRAALLATWPRNPKALSRPWNGWW